MFQVQPWGKGEEMFAVSKVKGGETVHKYLHWTYIQCETQFDMQIKICNLSNYMHFMQQTVYRKNDAIHAPASWGA